MDKDKIKAEIRYDNLVSFMALTFTYDIDYMINLIEQNLYHQNNKPHEIAFYNAAIEFLNGEKVQVR